MEEPHLTTLFNSLPPMLYIHSFCTTLRSNTLQDFHVWWFEYLECGLAIKKRLLRVIMLSCPRTVQIQSRCGGSGRSYFLSTNLYTHMSSMSLIKLIYNIRVIFWSIRSFGRKLVVFAYKRFLCKAPQKWDEIVYGFDPSLRSLACYLSEPILKVGWEKVQDDPKTTGRWWRDTQTLRKRLAVRFPAMKSPLYLTTFMSGGQLPLVLWRWPIGLLFQERKK